MVRAKSARTKSFNPVFDRKAGDTGNIIALEHLNVTVPDQSLATLFYVNGLGLTRDPYMDFGPVNVWVNVGREQFHLPTAKPQVLRGQVGLVVPDLDSLEKRLGRITPMLEGTRFSFKRSQSHLDVTCPWGNRIRCLAPDANRGPQLGLPWIELHVPRGTVDGIGRFYRDIIGSPAIVRRDVCEVSIGQYQSLRFRERAKPEPHYDGHHIAVYVTDFSGPHSRLDQRGLITEESDQHQYRFQAIIDPKNGKLLFELEHEVRSLFHPLYNRHLVNRNAEQSFFHYRKDRDAFTPR